MDALQITFHPPHRPAVIEQRLWNNNNKKNLFPAFEKIKSIFDNGESIIGSFSQQALLPKSRFSGEEATISDEAVEAPRAWASRKPPGARGSSLGTGPGGAMQEQ